MSCYHIEHQRETFPNMEIWSDSTFPKLLLTVDNTKKNCILLFLVHSPRASIFSKQRNAINNNKNTFFMGGKEDPFYIMHIPLMNTAKKNTF